MKESIIQILKGNNSFRGELKILILAGICLFWISIGFAICYILQSRSRLNYFQLSRGFEVTKTESENSFNLVKGEKRIGFIQIQGNGILVYLKNNRENLSVSTSIELEGDVNDVVSIIEVGDQTFPSQYEYHQVSGESWPPEGRGSLEKLGSLYHYFERVNSGTQH